jgi:membrane protease YdiL (CAAX protease family)
MTRHVVLVGHDASLATTIRSLLDPDDRLAEVHGVEGWRHVRQDEIDAVVVDLPSSVRLQAVEEVRSTYGGRLILLDPTDDPVSVPGEYDCLVVQRPDVEALSNLADYGRGLSTKASQVAKAGPTARTGSAPAPSESAPAGTVPADAQEGGLPTPEGQPPSGPTLFPPSLEDQSTDRDSIVRQMLSAQRPGIVDPSETDRPFWTAPLQADDRDVPQSVAVEIAERLRADVVVVLLDNGAGLMEASGGVGLTPMDVRLDVEYGHDAMRELFWTSIRLIEDTNRVGRRALAGIPGSHAETLLMAMLVHDHSWFGVLIAGRKRSQAGVPAEVFTDADVRSLVAIGEAATRSLHAVVLLRRLEWELKTGKNSMPAEPGPATVAEASGADTARASMPSPEPYSTLPVQTARSAPSTQDVAAQAAQSAGAADTGRAAPMLLGYLSTLAVIELAGSSPLVSVPVAAASYGLLALLLCLALRVTGDQRVAVLLPPLVAVSVVRLVTLAALPGDVSPLLRLVVVGVPALVAIAMAVRQRSPAWWLLRPHTGGWPGQLLVALVGIPSAFFVWAIAPPAVQVRGDATTMTAAVVLVIFAALPEELLYRGLLVPAAADVVGGWGILFAAAVYALTFLNGGSIRTVVLAFLLGVVLGWCRQLTGSVVGVIGAHSLLNVLVFLLLPAPGV